MTKWEEPDIGECHNCGKMILVHSNEKDEICYQCTKDLRTALIRAQREAKERGYEV